MDYVLQTLQTAVAAPTQTLQTAVAAPTQTLQTAVAAAYTKPVHSDVRATAAADFRSAAGV